MNTKGLLFDDGDGRLSLHHSDDHISLYWSTASGRHLQARIPLVAFLGAVKASEYRTIEVWSIGNQWGLLYPLTDTQSAQLQKWCEVVE